MSSIGSDDRARYDRDSIGEEDLNEQFNSDLQLAKDNNPDITMDMVTMMLFKILLMKNGWSLVVLSQKNTQLLFRGLMVRSSRENLYFRSNGLRTGIKSMLPFLQNASNLVELELGDNSIQSEEFNFLLGALCHSPVKILHCYDCDIESIHIDNDRYPAKLEVLNLFGNRVNEDGSREMAKVAADASLCNRESKSV